MEGSRQKTLSLWQRRNELPSLPLPGTIAVGLFLSLMTAICAQSLFLSLPLSLFFSGIGAALLLLSRTPLSLGLLLLSAVLGGVCAPDLPSAVGAMLFLPGAVALVWAVYAGRSRMTASVLCAGAALVSLLLGAGIWMLLCRYSLPQAAEAVRESVYTMLSRLQLPMPGGHRLTVFSPEAVQDLLRYLLPLSPAILVDGAFLFGCAGSGFLRLILRVLGAVTDFFGDEWYLIANRGCAVVWCAAQCMVLLAVTTPNAEGLYYAAYNVVLIFLLPLALCGLGTLIRQIRTVEALGSMSRAAILCLALMLAAAGLYWFFTAAALYGIYTVFRRGASGE